MKKLFTSLLFLGMMAPFGASAQLQLKAEAPANPDNEPVPVHPVPHPRQLKWQETEFYAFYHYGMNTYTGLEWGNGDENPTRFAPTAAPNPRQWLEVAKAAGMRGGIAVVKHHDGFCQWPTTTTDHNVTNSGNDYGRQTNIPRDFAAAAKDLGMKYGFYISPWDRNSVHYGTDKYGIVVDVRSGSIPDEECMNVPCSTSLRFDNTDVLRAGVSLFRIPVGELLPKFLVVRIEPSCVGHILGISQSDPPNICGSGYVRIDQGTNASKGVPDGAGTFGAVLDVVILHDFSGASIDVVVSVQFDARATTGVLLAGNYFDDVSHVCHLCGGIVIHLRGSFQFANISHCFTSLSKFSRNVYQ